MPWPNVSAKLWNCNHAEPLPGLANPFLGGVYLIVGLVVTVLYVPCLYVMTKRPLIESSCFKIMLALGVCDLWNIVVTCYVDGILSITGVDYCEHKLLFAMAGTSAAAVWKAYMLLIMLLAMNRAIKMSSDYHTLLLFDGRRAYFWIVGAFVFAVGYFVACLHKQTYFVYHSGLATHVWMPLDRELATFDAYFAALTSLGVAAPYVAVWALLRGQAKKISVASRPQLTLGRGLERRVIVQSALICTAAALVNVTHYVDVNVGGVSERRRTRLRLLAAVFQLCWIAAHCVNCVIYLTLNSTIRKGVIGILHLSAANKRKDSIDHTDSTTTPRKLDDFFSPSTDGICTPLSAQQFPAATQLGTASYHSADQTTALHGF